MLENLVFLILSENPFHRLIRIRRSMTTTMRDELLHKYDLMVEQQTIKYNGSNNPYELPFYNHVNLLKGRFWDTSFYESLILRYEEDKENGKR